MTEKTFDISTFKKIQNEMIAKNDQSWKSNYYHNSINRVRDYSLEEIYKIIHSSSLTAQQKLSRNYFDGNGFYKRIVLYYATLLTYSGLLIPNPSFGKKLTTPHISKRYYAALDYIDKINLAEILTRMSIKALIYGSYYGVIKSLTKDQFVLFDLPPTYCRSSYLDIYGNEIIEFNVTYFNTITDKDMRQQALNTYPKIVSSYYHKYDKSKVISPWVKLPTDVGICFSFSDEGRPMFLNVIPATIQYDDAVETERERELEEIRKIIIQKVPHLNDGTLLFEPEEALEMHTGSVGMVKGNKNLSVLTTYADVDSIVSRTSTENASASLERMLQNVYSEAGTSQQLFAPTNTQSLSSSIDNDISFMMILANKYSRFITKILNLLFSNSNISFKYTILPISLYNRSDYITDSMKLAQTGYSLLIPALAMGLSQRELINIKSLENDVLKLNEVLIPLSSSYTQSKDKNESGAPKKKQEDKAEKTIQNEESIANQGGSE